jgi:hypothetical protein
MATAEMPKATTAQLLAEAKKRFLQASLPAA